MGILSYFTDGLVNALTGAGTRVDPRTYNAYQHRKLSDHEISAAYRGSWLMRKIVDKPASEMVREYRTWQAEADQIEKLEALERKLDLRNKVRAAETLRRLGGGAMVLWVGNEDPAFPINPNTLGEGSLRGVHVWHRSRFSLEEMETDPASDWYGYPKFYKLSNRDGRQIRIHPSRVVAFRGQPVPDMAITSWEDAFWGDSRVQTVMDAVQNSDTAQNGFAALIKDARNRRLSIPGLTEMLSTTTGEEIFGKRVAAMAMGESMYGVTYLDAGGSDGKGGEKIEDRQMSWAGIPDINASYLAMVAGAADMPATVLLGKSPDGMNATGDGDLKVWEKTVKGWQDLDLRPCLDQLDVVLVPTALGSTPKDVWWEFAPLSTLDETAEATVFKTTMDAMAALQSSGSIPDIAFSKGMQNLVVERGWVPGLDGALAEIPEAERFPEQVEPDLTGADPSALTQPDPTKPGQQQPAKA